MSAPIPGDIVLSRGNSWASKLICFVTKSQWSHVGIYIGMGYFIDSAIWQGVRVGHVSILDHYQYFHIDITDEQRNAVLINAESKIGQKYDIMQVVLLWWRIITDTMHKNHDDPNPDQYVCSEFVAEMYAGVGVSFGKYVDNVLPNHIANSDIVSPISN